MKSIRQGLILNDIKKIFKMKCEHSPGNRGFPQRG